MRATIKDIAAHCRVSEGTVDRALNNRPGISEKTKGLILESAKQLNYMPNHAGRSLATGLTMTIGIVCFDLHNNFFPELIDTIEAKAKQRGYFIHLILSHMNLKTEREGLEFLYGRRVDGIILFPIGIGQEYIDYLKNLHIPIVTVYNRLSSEFPHVGVDSRRAMSDAVSFLVERGYQRIVFLSPHIDLQESRGNNVYTLRQRLLGYCDGVARHELEPLCFQGGDMVRRMSALFARQKDLRTALMCSCDSYALMLLDELRCQGLRVPEDVGLMGFDNVDVLRYIRPKLTTIRYSVQKMGEVLFERLHAQIEGAAKTADVLLSYEVVEGETV